MNLNTKDTIVDQVCIRPVTRQDLPALEWNGQYRHFRRLFVQAFQRAEAREAVLWVAELPEVGIVGQVFVQLTSHRTELADGSTRAYIYGFRVKPRYRGAGIGSLLLLTAESDLKGRGFRRISLNVGRENTSARRLYERLGFRVVAAEPGIWSFLDDRGRRRHVNEPAWRMEKEI